ncbi:MAG: hypothetical protein JXB88_21555 [Spirochaetales bacterium]|nr:hypothetical protein [Spirochaetales bacterium]
MNDKSDFRFKIPLKQHSPLIHFQVKKEGPKDELIRISEFKPLIERFVKHYFTAFDPGLYNNFKKCIGEYFNKDKKQASAYKLHASTDLSPNKKNKNTKKDTAYFGDYCEIEYPGLTLTLFSYHKEVLELLKSVIPIVLSGFNLGTRKSKGFGSFTPVTMKEKEFQTNLIKLYKQENIFVKNNIHYFRNEVNKIYQLLKSGKNKPYEKSMLYEYFMKKGIRWEKAALKRKIAYKVKEKGSAWHPLLNTSGKYPENEHTDISCSFIRALLGLAGHYTFLNNNRERQYTVSVEHEEVKRIPSPILFKVFENKLYAISVWEFYREEYKNILGKTFKFIIKNNEIRGNHSEEDTIQLDLETPSVFDLRDFLTGNLLKMGYTKL